MERPGDMSCEAWLLWGGEAFGAAFHHAALIGCGGKAWFECLGYCLLWHGYFPSILERPKMD